MISKFEPQIFQIIKFSQIEMTIKKTKKQNHTDTLRKKYHLLSEKYQSGYSL